MGRLLRVLFLSLLVVVATGCTSVGLHDSAARQQLDFGPPGSVALCLYVDDGISEQFARTLIEDAWRDEAPLYGISVNVVKVVRWSRPAFQMNGIMDAIARVPLQPPCDRILALIGRNAGDFMWNLLPLPEVLGAVDDQTLTHGYTVARWATLNQVFSSPTSVTRHEIYHFLGCDEHFEMRHCYKQIQALKQWKQAHQSDFFPAWDAVTKRMLVSREAVNARLNGTAAASAPSTLTNR
jgi:hypothetical protein